MSYQSCFFKILFEIHVIQALVQLHIERICQKESLTGQQWSDKLHTRIQKLKKKK